jgi:hypothetical protein
VRELAPLLNRLSAGRVAPLVCLASPDRPIPTGVKVFPILGRGQTDVSSHSLSPPLFDDGKFDPLFPIILSQGLLVQVAQEPRYFIEVVQSDGLDP